jgi:alcohol dehydrogenase class IV
MLPVALETNRSSCERELAELARAVWDEAGANDAAAADAFVARIVALCRDLGVPRQLRDLNVARTQIPALVESAHGNSLDGNPVAMTDDQLHSILERMW